MVIMIVWGWIELLIWDMNIYRWLYIYLKLKNKKGYDFFLVVVVYMYWVLNYIICFVFKYIYKYIIEVCLFLREKIMEMFCLGCWKLN